MDVPLDGANPGDFDPLSLPDGVMNPDKLRMDPKAVKFAKAFFDADKPVAVICHGPWTVIATGCEGEEDCFVAVSQNGPAKCRNSVDGSGSDGRWQNVQRDAPHRSETHDSGDASKLVWIINWLRIVQWSREVPQGSVSQSLKRSQRKALPWL